MKTTLLYAGLSSALLFSSSPHLQAQEESPEIVGLHKAASDFVAAYNKKDAAAVAALFTENGEIADLKADDVTSGREDIQARYEAIFAAPDAPKMAVEVDTVRIVGKDLAIEDGTVHLTSPDEDDAPQSMSYTAVLQKNDKGVWQIASTRDLGDVSDTAGHLAILAKQLKGDWTAEANGMRLDIAFGWDDTGKYLKGEMLATASDSKEVSTDIRIGWDPSKRKITWWSFDDGGGFSKGEWTPIDEGWMIRTEGTTADGEETSANQLLSFEDKDTFTFTSKGRLIDGELQPDVNMRVVRQAPEASDDDDDDKK